MNREVHVPFYEGLGVKFPRSTLRTELEAAQVGVIQSLMSTCKLHGVNSYTYLVDVMQRVQVHPNNRIIELTPRMWKENFEDDPILSDSELETHYVVE